MAFLEWLGIQFLLDLSVSHCLKYSKIINFALKNVLLSGLPTTIMMSPTAPLEANLPFAGLTVSDTKFLDKL